MNNRPSSALNRAAAALGAVLAVAVVSRVVWELLRPVVPTLIVLLVLIGLVRLAIGRYRRW